MPRDYRLYVEDILTAIARVRAYVEEMSYDTFRTDEKTQDAVVRRLEVIGEAARMLPESVKAGAPHVEWRKFVGLRNVLTHQYFGLSLPIIWDIVANKLDALEAACRQLAEELG